MEGQYDRFKDADWFPKDNECVVIGGQGGIGSWLSFFMSKIGYRVYAYDYDTIEVHNLSGQFFKTADIGKFKVNAVADIVKDFCDAEYSFFNGKIDENSPTHYYMFSAFDNMQARKDMFKVWKRSIDAYPDKKHIFIDGRLTMEQLQIFCVTSNKIEEYEKHLFDDSEVEDAPCSMKQTSHSAAMIATHMTALFTNHITNVYNEFDIREVPFYYEFFIPLTLTEIEL